MYLNVNLQKFHAQNVSVVCKLTCSRSKGAHNLPIGIYLNQEITQRGSQLPDTHRLPYTTCSLLAARDSCILLIINRMHSTELSSLKKPLIKDEVPTLVESSLKRSNFKDECRDA